MAEQPRTWQLVERRALVADLVRTQAVLQARSDQLQQIFASRWYRLARFSWRLRRGTLFGKASPPRMAGEESFAQPLDGNGAQSPSEGGGADVAVLLLGERSPQPEAAIESLLEQSLAPGEVLLGNPDEMSAERQLDRLGARFLGTRICAVQQDEALSRSERLRELAELAEARWVAPLEPTLLYERDHLRELVACTHYAGAEVIGFPAPSRGDFHCYVEAVPPHSALAARHLVAERGWPRDEAAMREWFAQGVRIYAGAPPGRATMS
ncbi:MAG TPA: hypothetical protein VHQ43_08230 [Solirubrobacterales bacterium]|jgi:hypothetical protein|nr:hypothetical protein [Solirubrobacterales bacterium]